MQVSVVRSGLAEAFHTGAWAITDPAGRLIDKGGDTSRPFYFRSSAKPFQAAVSQRLGAGLDPERLAVAAGSHDGEPVHVALVEAMLSEAALGESDLGCPPAWPASRRATRRLVATGHRSPRRIWHNCSGKHTAMLRACLAQGWDPRRYLEPDHPYQLALSAEMVAVAGPDALPVGVDGCGTPVHRATVETLAASFAGLAGYHEVWEAMHRYPALASGAGHADTVIALWLNGVAKRGAEGCIGVSVAGFGGMAVKIWDGSDRAMEAGILAVLHHSNWIPAGVIGRITDALTRPVLGAGKPVGELLVTLEES